MADQLVATDQTTPATREQRGRIVGGRYLLGDRIGTGGAAMVYRALDLRLNRPVAVKVMHPFFTGSTGLLQEARRAAAIASPHIVGVLDAGEDPEPFLVMELAPGGGLDRLITAAPLTPGQAVTVGVAVARALDAAHDRGLVHGDVKPSNILATPGGPKLGDFGSALVRRAGAATLPPSAIAATVMFAAPEQFAGKPVPASDQYALALTLLACLAGHLPWDAPEQAISAKRDGDVDPGDACGPLRPVLAQALHRDPATRFASAGLMAKALSLAAQPEPLPEVEPLPEPSQFLTTTGALVRPPHSAPWRRAVATAAILAGIGGFVAAGVLLRGSGDAPRTLTVAPLPVLDVAGLSYGEAVARLGGFDVSAESVASDQPPGTVLGSDPPGDTVLPPGGHVTIQLAAPAAAVSVPDLSLAPNVTAAQEVLASTGLAVRLVEVTSEQIPAGGVVSQFPDPGVAVAPSSSVRVDVSTGPEEIAVPEVVGMPVADATQLLADLGFLVAHTDTQGSGVVISQQPLPGQTEPRGFEIAIFS